jgi:hypothetical protein
MKSFYYKVAVLLIILLGSGTSVFSQTIRIISGSYGFNCGAKGGNATPDLANSCNGRANCQYKIDPNIIGDPTPGCAKTYVADYQCGTSGKYRRITVSPEAGGSTLNINCGSAISGIRVISASYGEGTCQHFDTVRASNDLSKSCNGKTTCEYIIDSNVIGNPAVGCKKDYTARWNCGSGTSTRRIHVGGVNQDASGLMITLSCP